MAINTAVIMMPMSIESHNTGIKYVALLLLIPFVAALHAAILSALIALNSGWSLQLAESISFDNPDVAYAQAEFYRIEDPQKSLGFWLQAARLRPLWPYHQLGALDAEYRLGVSDEQFSARLQRVLELSGNERGMDRGVFELSLLRWQALSFEQKMAVAERLQISSRASLKYAIEIAEQVQKKDLICGMVAPKRTRGLCY